LIKFTSKIDKEEGMESLLTIQQLAEKINLRPATIYKMTSSKRIPHIKIGNRVFFEEARIEAWIESKNVEPLST
jgi:excisionase family DNA binding protein